MVRRVGLIRRSYPVKSDTANPLRRVAYLYPYLFQYRSEFHELLRETLAKQNIQYDVIYSSEPHFGAGRGDFVALPWAIDVKCTYLSILGAELRYQHAFFKALKYDLLIIQQENGLLVNYPLQLLRRLLGLEVAFFGHGRNFQSSKPGGIREIVKKYWITKVDWWFAYTELSARLVRAAGYDPKKITVFNNSIDTKKIQSEIADITDQELSDLRVQLKLSSDNIGIFIGALYDKKRIRFLIESSARVRELIPDFQLLIIGGGEDRHIVDEALQACNWIHYLGPKFGRDKTLYAKLAKVFLMPGLVGLGILDSFAYGTPMVTTNVSYHSPEIEYLQDGENGVLVTDIDSVEAYAAAVAKVLVDGQWRQRLREGGTRSLQQYTVEHMADRFAQGITSALAGG